MLQSVSNYVVTAIIAEHIYDLALIKTLTPGVSYMQTPGASVLFDVIIQNQSSLPVENITVTDSFPSGLIFDASASAGWTAGASSADYTYTGTLQPGGTGLVQIGFTIDPAFTGTGIINWAEISDDNLVAMYGVDAEDQDSTPESTQ